ncbi:MAG: glycosyltransferase family 1 protein [Anaerolineae bacterium]|nr:glycosyltransferase family 1 protein [Anaerolineae bacterium]
MKITICALGSRGDTQPFLALAVGLQQAGHRVTLAATHNFAEWIRSQGVTAYPVRHNPQEDMQDPEIQAAIKGRNWLRQLPVLRDKLNAILSEMMDDCWQAAEDAEFVIVNTIAYGGAEIASQRDIPMAFAALQPLYPTRAFSSFAFPFAPGGRWNYLTHKLGLRLMWLMFGVPINHWRTTRFDVSPWRSFSEIFNARRDFDTPWLWGYSPLVVPKPPDWEDHHYVTGYWFLDAPSGWQPPAELACFLESGPPPVYMGFGSMSDKDPERQTRLALRALEITGQRGVLSTGWGGIARLATSASVFYIDDVPHGWLFPRMAAVVHHGGAGTTAAGLRAGVPGIITPYSGDQYGWARWVEKLGVGPRITDNKRLTAEKLAQAIDTAVNDSALRARAAALGDRIRAENGVARAAEVIERHSAEFNQRFDSKR